MNKQLLKQEAATSVGTWVNITPPGVRLEGGAPEGGSVWTVVMDPQNTKTLYIGTSVNGIWKTTDGGNNWFQIDTGVNSSQENSGNHWTLEIDPVNPQILYTTAGYGAGGLWKSTDGGVDWTNVLNNSPTGNFAVDNVAIDPSNHLHLLVASKIAPDPSVGVVESMDGGNTWVTHPQPANMSSENWVFFLNDSSSWILTSTDGHYDRTTDGGKTWKPVTFTNDTPGYISVLGDLYHAPNGVLYIGGDHAMYRSTDNGATWTAVLPGTTNGYYYGTVISDGTTLFTQTGFSTNWNLGQTNYVTSPLTDGVNWSYYSNQSTCVIDVTGTQVCSGPFQMAYDPVNHIIYSANLSAGIWKLDEGSVVTPTPCAGTCPTATPTPLPTNTPTPTVGPSPTPTPTTGSTPTLPPTGTYLGNSTVGSSVDSGDTNSMNGSKFQMGATNATVTSMSVNVGTVDPSPNNQYSMAIYADNNGVPGALVAQTANGILTPNAWNTLSLSANLSAGQSYWLLYNTNGTTANSNEMRYNSTGGTNGWSSNAVTFGTWPNPFGSFTMGGSANFSIYATLSNGAVTPTITPLPTNTPVPTIAPPTATTVPSTVPSITPSCTPNTGDINQDGKIDLTDFSMFAADYGKTTSQLKNPRSDLNCDGIVDLTDFSTFAKNYGKVIGTPTP